MRLYLVCVLLLVSCGLLGVIGRSVIKKEGQPKKQSTLDKEVLFEDEDYEDDDVLDLPPEEQKSRLKSLVEKKMDVNQDGFIDAKELHSWTLKAFDSFENDDAKEEFSMVDVDKDGAVSWREHSDDAHGKGYGEESPEFANPEAEEGIEKKETYLKDKKIFAAADRDGNEILDLMEYFNFKHPRRNPETSQVLIEDKLESLDANKNGGIDLEEYLKDTKNADEDEALAESETERFGELDGDGDGVLRGSELLQWIDPDNSEEADDEADHLMTESDKDEDGKLSPDEIVNNHELWVESDATDYGRQLMLNHDEF
uniref:reticulocalbin-2 n=1 Tax=Ciona intestinalis TaxID=7719 RepID=UPI000180C1F7|nr:reticulocalbin-2 [Ciona intestinalis]|eukprot:XP_002129310.1 reticulocalbin-2 [Ciona intestinalis]